MTKLLQNAFEQAQRLPADEQDAAAGALLDYLDHMRKARLTGEQVAEVRRRLAEPNPELLTPDQLKARLRRLAE